MAYFWLFWSPFVVHSQEKPKSDLPPDLTHIVHLGCNHKQELVDSLNAETGKSQELEYWHSEGYAKYEKVDEPWTHPLGTFPGVERDVVPPDATAACGAWMKKLKQAIVEDQGKRGHSVKAVQSKEKKE